MEVEKENQIKLIDKFKNDEQSKMDCTLKETVSKYEASIKKYEDLELKNKNNFTIKMNELITQHNKQKEELKDFYEQQLESIKSNFVSTHENYKEKFKNAIDSLKDKHSKEIAEINKNSESLNNQLKEITLNHESVIHEYKMKLENVFNSSIKNNYLAGNWKPKIF